MIYLDYNACLQNCYKGICELTYNTILNQNEYTCKANTANYYWWFLIVPLFLLLFAILFSCTVDKQLDQLQTHIPAELVLVPAQKKYQNLVPAQDNVQQVTLPNGQVGVFIPLEPGQIQQQTQVQQQAPQFTYQQKVQNIEMPQSLDV
ncbi:Hypothetical_protein [Hexamita inflata]|uniref:Hypothetical_protein n=1 Tax=Hexamita inflata TaxID=28002 RepID=A0AA86UJ87_9EUKA|nr:Hypothetical protein HINF_LOCUS45524 [Hexamita inflata]